MYSFADDNHLCGPAGEIIEVALTIQILFRERAGLKFRSWSILRGAEAPIITAAQLVERGFEGTVEVLGEFDDAPNQRQGLGLEVGEKGGGDAAMRVVGGPAGDAVKAAAYVDEVVNKHKKRLTLISSLGDVDPQSALLLLTYCAVPRLHFLLQMVPYDLAQDGFREGYNDILNAWRLNTDISEEEFAKPLVAGRVALPWRWGGQAITDPETVADATLVSCWDACAPFLANASPALYNISEETGGVGPRWGYLQPAWERVLASGDEEKLILPDFQDSAYMEYRKGTQRALSATRHARDFTNLHTTAVVDALLVEATAMQSLSGEGATAWHQVIPFAEYAVLAPSSVRTAIRFELNLQHHDLERAAAEGATCHCCAKRYTKDAVHHVITVPKGNSGGNRYMSHNKLLHQVAVICEEAGCTTSKHCAGLLGPDPARGPRHRGDKVMDISIVGLRNDVTRVLGDVRITHPIGGSGAVAGMPQPTCAADVKGAAAGNAEVEKKAWYGGMAEKRSMVFVPMCVETYGRFGPDFLAFIKEVADKGTSKVATLNHVRIAGDAPESKASYSRRLYHRHLRLLSLTRVRTIAERINGAAITDARATAAEGRVIVQRALFQDAEQHGLPALG